MTTDPTLAPPSVPAPPPADASRPRLNRLFSDVELVIAVLLGLVSVITAYSSFQAALYDSQMASSYTRGQNLSTEAESLYLEADQQFVQDVQTWSRLTELSIDMSASDPVLAKSATDKFNTLHFQNVSTDLSAAINWSNAQNDANPAVYVSPFDNPDYQNALFAPSAEVRAQSAAAIKAGDTANSFSDRLTLNSVLLTVALFLLGVAGVVRQLRTQLVLMGVSVLITVVAVVLTLAVPFVSL